MQEVHQMRKFTGRLLRKVLSPKVKSTLVRLLKLVGAYRYVVPAHQPRSAWCEKIESIGGIIDDKYITVGGLRFGKCYRDFPLVVAENIYHQYYNVTLNGDYIAIDVGANAGVSALFLSQNDNIKLVYAFEPLVPIYQMLLYNLKLNPAYSGKIRPFNFGLGCESLNMTIPYCQDQAMSTSSKGIYDRFFNRVDSYEIIAIREAWIEMQTILSAVQSEKILLKMDCEGLNSISYRIYFPMAYSIILIL